MVLQFVYGTTIKQPWWLPILGPKFVDIHFTLSRIEEKKIPRTKCDFEYCNTYGKTPGRFGGNLLRNLKYSSEYRYIGLVENIAIQMGVVEGALLSLWSLCAHSPYLHTKSRPAHLPPHA